MRVYFMDEVRGVPSGWRGVSEVKVGRKWAYFKVEEKRHKVSKVIWEGLSSKSPEVVQSRVCATRGPK
jgi:hypothetical protein